MGVLCQTLGNAILELRFQVNHENKKNYLTKIGINHLIESYDVSTFGNLLITPLNEKCHKEIMNILSSCASNLKFKDYNAVTSNPAIILKGLTKEEADRLIGPLPKKGVVHLESLRAKGEVSQIRQILRVKAYVSDHATDFKLI